MNTPIKIGFSAFILMASQFAEAEIIGPASYGGTGCPDGTVSSFSSQSRKTVTLKLSAMETRTGDQTGAAISRKACAISIPVEVPAGQTIESVQATYEGNAIVAEGANLKFQTEHFTAGTQGKINKLTLEANESSAFGLSQYSKIGSVCGQDVNLRANFSLLNQGSANAALTAGKIQRVKYKIILAACTTN